MSATPSDVTSGLSVVQSTSNTVGGTSNGTAGSGTNVLSLNLGGADVSYDLGPDTSALASQAYNFLDNSFDSDDALLGNTIVGSQNFLSGLAAPAESAVASQESFNTETLPSMFNSLEQSNESLGSQAINASEEESEASIKGSEAEYATAESNKGGFCFITTAACEVMGEADDGPTLTTLRGFRDYYMQDTAVRQALVRLYYDLAPRILAALDEPRLSQSKRNILQFVYFAFLQPAVQAVKHGREDKAFALYRLMLLHMGRITGLLRA